MEWRTYNLELAIRIGVAQAVLLGDIAAVIASQDPKQTRELNGRTYMHGHRQTMATRLPECGEYSIHRWLAVLTAADYLVCISVPHGKTRQRWYAIGPRAEPYVDAKP